MQPESKRYLLDVQDAAKSIQEFTAARTMADLTQDKFFKSAVYWQFAIIGEALAQLRQQDLPTFDRITDSWRIVGFRNQIIHGYQKVQDDITWQIVQENLPVLLQEMEQLLKE